MKIKRNCWRIALKTFPTSLFYHGDCNEILLDQIFPRVKYEDYRRGLCFLDPYGLHLGWEVLQRAGEMKSLEIFLNFPIMDMNRNSLWKDFNSVGDERIQRMDRFWGDDSWKDAAYSISPQGHLFGEEIKEKETNQAIAEKFRQRLKGIGGFRFVPEPIPMRNSTGATIYYLFFASNNEKGAKIATHILNKYKLKGLT